MNSECHSQSRVLVPQIRNPADLQEGFHWAHCAGHNSVLHISASSCVPALPPDALFAFLRNREGGF